MPVGIVEQRAVECTVMTDGLDEHIGPPHRYPVHDRGRLVPIARGVYRNGQSLPDQGLCQPCSHVIASRIPSPADEPGSLTNSSRAAFISLARNTPRCSAGSSSSSDSLRSSTTIIRWRFMLIILHHSTRAWLDLHQLRADSVLPDCPEAIGVPRTGCDPSLGPDFQPWEH